MPRQRLDQVDAMRPMKQAGVIGTHVLTFFTPAASGVSTGAVMLLTHFSREGFFFISACMLTYAYMDLDRGGLRRFYGRRLVAVAVPYLCWSVIYFLYLLPTAHYASAAVALENFAKEIATGYYQLYFLLIIMQYYLVFPLLMMFLRRTRDHHGAIVVIAALGHVGLMTLLHWTIVPVLRTGWFEEFTPYAFYLIAGSIAAFHLYAINEWLVRHARLVIALTVAAAIGAEAVYFLAATGVTTALGAGNDPFQPSVIPFDVGAIACLYLLGVFLVKPGRSRRLRAAVRSGSDNSYGVYLSQMLFINALIWAGWARLDSVVWWPLLCAATVVIVFLAGVALTSLLARTPLAVPLTGRQQQPWASRRLVSGRPGRDETVLVGENHGLNPIAQAELGQHPGHVSLDRGLGDVQCRCYLRVGQPGGCRGGAGVEKRGWHSTFL
jgi:peptidoglycan/LPS O-acetylase OafA/YrhL